MITERLWILFVLEPKVLRNQDRHYLLIFLCRVRRRMTVFRKSPTIVTT